MRIQIAGILDRRSPSQERLHLRVVTDANLSFYVVFDTTYLNPTAISNKQRHAYWFPPRAVKAGDHVVLYSGRGADQVQKNTDGTTTHFFYWGLDRPIWNNTGDCALLFEVNTWQTSRYE